jgi:flagellar motor switch protein FliM
LGKPREEVMAPPGPSKAGKTMLTKLGVSIKAGLSAKIQVDLTGENPRPLQVWLKNLGSEDWVIAIRQREGDPQPSIITLGAAAVSNLTSLAFGGQEPSSTAEDRRSLTGLEIELLPVLAETFLPAVLEPGEAPHSKPIVCRADRFDASSLSKADAVVFHFNLSCGAMTWPLQIALFSEGAAGVGGSSHSEKSTSWKAHVSEEIGRSKLTAEAVVNLHPHTLAKLKSLRVGDVIPIPEGSLKHCALRARGEPVYSGRLGRQGDMYSFRVSAPARKRGSLVDSIVKGIDRNATANRSGTK